jgi:transcriptional regulator with XRE-family HTH domain
MKLTEKLGNKLRSLRKEKNLTQENIASMLKMSSTAYSKIERGEVDISISRIEDLARVFEVPTEKLISEENNTFVFSNFHDNTGVGQNTFNVSATATNDEMKLMLMGMNTILQQLDNRFKVMESTLKT